jgi:hypothetical protein
MFIERHDGQRRITQIARNGPRLAAGGELHAFHVTTAAGPRGTLAEARTPMAWILQGSTPWCRDTGLEMRS